MFRAALKTPGILFLCLMYFTQTYGFNLYVTWMPTYLQHEKHLHGKVLAVLAGLPLLLSVQQICLAASSPIGSAALYHWGAVCWYFVHPERTLALNESPRRTV